MKPNFVRTLALTLGLALAGPAIAEECVLVLPFETGSAALSARNQELLRQLAQEYPDASASVTGHTDAVGNDALNQPLSERRVRSTIRYLRANGGQGMSFSTRAEASRVPIEVTQRASQLNRRVEVRVRDCDPSIFTDGGRVAQGVLQGGLAGPAAVGAMAFLVLGLSNGSSSSTTTTTTTTTFTN